ncbi:MAG TPA: hypothetical protein PLY23_09035 [Alphaproteobacteria bacterium]|nr:hypothetical protein [Alphaproteobacteria bacterium]HQS94755.1 hypothetical protein [Alphaproteobacteria bacterium]
MDWTQTLTIISSMVAVWYAFYHIIKEDIKRHDIELGEIRKETREMRQETREEFSKAHALWAGLLKEISDTQKQIFNVEKQIYDIRLDQSRRS